MSTQREKYNAFIDPIIHDLLATREEIDIQDVLDQLQDVIVNAHSRMEINHEWKSTWISVIKLRANELKATLTSKKPNWGAIDKRIETVASRSTSKSTTPRRSRTSTSSSLPTPKISSSSNSLRVPLTEDQKNEIPKMLDGLDKNKFWILEATKQEAQKNNKPPLSVEEKIKNFAMKCNYVHPSLSLILDVDDKNWTEEFSKEELEELQEYGKPLLRDLPQELSLKLDEIFEQDSALDAYNFGRRIEYDPIKEPMLAWLSLTLMNTAKFFLKDGTYNTDAFLESDSLYYLWSFFNTVFHGSNITPIGKEKSSNANAAAQNAKRKLSAIEGIESRKMGRRIDTIYEGSHIELGCLEIGKTTDDTNEFEDSMVKLPIVMKDMIIAITTHMPSILNDVHILGYNINGHSISLLDADVPKGYVTRIRRTNDLPYPTRSEDYARRIVPLLELALNGKLMAEETLYKYDHTRVRPTRKSCQVSPLPPCFNSGLVPKSSASTASETSGSTAPSTTTTSTAGSTDTHGNKRRR